MKEEPISEHLIEKINKIKKGSFLRVLPNCFAMSFFIFKSDPEKTNFLPVCDYIKLNLDYVSSIKEKFNTSASQKIFFSKPFLDKGDRVLCLNKPVLKTAKWQIFNKDKLSFPDPDVLVLLKFFFKNEKLFLALPPKEFIAAFEKII